MIVVNDIHKSFGEVRAVRGVSFEAPDGKITGLLGPNGAGKSTTLRVLYTVLQPDQGGATIDGADVVVAETGDGIIGSYGVRGLLEDEEIREKENEEMMEKELSPKLEEEDEEQKKKKEGETE